MRTLKALLEKKLRDAPKIALLGIGSLLCGDDAAGPLILRYLKKNKPFGKNKTRVKVFSGGTAPENITGEIKKFHPTHLVMVDAADMGLKPGGVAFIDPKRVAGVSFSTHRLPTTIMAEYLSYCISCEVIIIGVQPKSLEFGQSPSREIDWTAQQLARVLLGIFNRSAYKNKS